MRRNRCGKTAQGGARWGQPSQSCGRHEVLTSAASNVTGKGGVAMINRSYFMVVGRDPLYSMGGTIVRVMEDGSLEPIYAGGDAREEAQEEVRPVEHDAAEDGQVGHAHHRCGGAHLLAAALGRPEPQRVDTGNGPQSRWDIDVEATNNRI